MFKKTFAMMVCAAFFVSAMALEINAKPPKKGPKFGSKPGAKPGLPKPGSKPGIPKPGIKPGIPKPGTKLPKFVGPKVNPKLGVNIGSGGIAIQVGPVVVSTRRLGRIVVGTRIRRVTRIPTQVVYQRPTFTGVTPVRVVRVLDPSMIVVNLNNTPTKVRLLGVQLAAASDDDKKTMVEGTRYMKTMLEGQFVYLDFDQTVARNDDEGNPVAYIYRAEDQYFANNDVIRQGYAVAATGYEFAHDDLFNQSQFNAQSEKAGLWSMAMAE